MTGIQNDWLRYALGLSLVIGVVLFTRETDAVSQSLSAVDWGDVLARIFDGEDVFDRQSCRDTTDDTNDCRHEAEIIPRVKGYTLHEVLDRYYTETVEIDTGAMADAQHVVDEVVEMLPYQLEKTWPNWGIGRLKQVGSTVEGLKVVEPDEFDFMIPITLDESNWELIDASYTTHSAPGFWLLKKLSDPYTPFDRHMSQAHLSPARMRSVFQSILQKVINQNPTRYSIKSSTHGPSITYDIDYIVGMRKKSLSIDLVPTFSIYNGWWHAMVEIVAKPHRLSRAWSQHGDQLYDTLWRRSFSADEGQVLSYVTGNEVYYVKCLKILKALRLKNPQLAMLSSYVLKTVLLHELRKFKDTGQFNGELSNPFKHLVKALLSYVEKRHLPHYFSPDVNLLSEYKETALDNLEGYLKGALENLDY